MIADLFYFFSIRFITVKNQLPDVKLLVRTNVAIYVLNYKIYLEDWTYGLNTIWPRPNVVICLSNTARAPSEKRDVNFFTWCSFDKLDVQNFEPVNNLSKANYLFISVWQTPFLTLSKWKYFAAMFLYVFKVNDFIQVFLIWFFVIKRTLNIAGKQNSADNRSFQERSISILLFSLSSTSVQSVCI